MEAGSRAESFVIANGSDLRTASMAVTSVRSCRSTGLPLVGRAMGPTTSNEGRRSDRRKRVA